MTGVEFKKLVEDYVNNVKNLMAVDFDHKKIKFGDFRGAVKTFNGWGVGFSFNSAFVFGTEDDKWSADDIYHTFLKKKEYTYMNADEYEGGISLVEYDDDMFTVRDNAFEKCNFSEEDKRCIVDIANMIHGLDKNLMAARAEVVDMTEAEKNRLMAEIKSAYNG